MALVSILTVIILILGFFGGAKEGAVKRLFSLTVFLAAIPLSGASYRLVASLLSFLPGRNWENFVGFFIALVVIGVILHVIFWIPQKIVRTIWKRGIIFRLAGGISNLFQTAIGLVLFTLLISAYPVFDWLEAAVTGSGVILFLMERLGFVAEMLPAVFRSASPLAGII